MDVKHHVYLLITTYKLSENKGGEGSGRQQQRNQPTSLTNKNEVKKGEEPNASIVSSIGEPDRISQHVQKWIRFFRSIK